MKKILSIILVISICLCLFAGCNQEESSSNTTNTTDTTNSTSVSTNTTTDTGALKEEEKQEFYEEFFEKEKYTLQDSNFSISSSGIKITCLSDDKDRFYFEIATENDDDKNEVALYMVDADSVYYHTAGTDEGQEFDVWKICTYEEREDAEESEIEEQNNKWTENLGIDSIIAHMENVVDVQYTECENGLDKVVIKYEYIDEDAIDIGMDVTISFTYNEQDGEYTYRESDVGKISFATKSIDDFDLLDWTFDREKLTLTKGDEVIQCVLVRDNLAETSEPTIELEIDSVTHEIKKLKNSLNGQTTVWETIECDDVTDIVPVPEAYEEIDILSAYFQFTMALFSFAMMVGG